jgi:hypothetical protein
VGEIAARNTLLDNPTIIKRKYTWTLRESGPAFRFDNFGVYLQIKEKDSKSKSKSK